MQYVMFRTQFWEGLKTPLGPSDGSVATVDSGLRLAFGFTQSNIHSFFPIFGRYTPHHTGDVVGPIQFVLQGLSEYVVTLAFQPKNPASLPSLILQNETKWQIQQNE